jgi:N-acetylmuramic acid 6-phosphate etherase
MADTETRNPDYVDIDEWPTQRAVTAMLDEQIAALQSIQSQTAALADASEAAAARLKTGGRLVYAGAGTSGRIAVQDGVELGPTFNWPSDRLGYLIAGGMAALAHSAEGAEDDREGAVALVTEQHIGAADVVIGIAASGRTPFTIGAIEAARAAGALTIAIANNADTPLLAAADHAICAASGAEVIAGSTRMKAGTAQKTIANLISTAIMLRLGRVYKGLMVDMVISNDKLLHRAQGIVQSLTYCSPEEAATAIATANHDIKQAVLIAMGRSAEQAEALLDHNSGLLRGAIDALVNDPQ